VVVLSLIHLISITSIENIAMFLLKKNEIIQGEIRDEK